VHTLDTNPEGKKMTVERGVDGRGEGEGLGVAVAVAAALAEHRQCRFRRAFFR